MDGRNETRTLIAAALTGGFMLAEVIGGLLTGALALLGYRTDLPVTARLDIQPELRIGEVLTIAASLESPEAGPVLVDYRLRFARPTGSAEKVFKLKAAELAPGKTLTLTKRHRMKGDATTFRLHPGPHAVILQVNGRDVAEAGFTLRD